MLRDQIHRGIVHIDFRFEGHAQLFYQRMQNHKGNSQNQERPQNGPKQLLALFP